MEPPADPVNSTAHVNPGLIRAASNATTQSDISDVKNKSSYHGMFYHLQLGMVIFLRAYHLHCEEKLPQFEIKMEDQEGGKFDDILLRYELSATSTGTVYIQAKHKDLKAALKPIELEDLLKGDKSKVDKSKKPFLISTYFVSYLENYQKQKEASKNHAYLLCTNAALGKTLKNILSVKLQPENDILSFCDTAGGKCYGFNHGSDFNVIRDELRNVSLEMLAKVIASHISENKPINDEMLIFKLYHALILNCVDPDILKFNRKFLTAPETSPLGKLRDFIGNKKGRVNPKQEMLETTNIFIESNYLQYGLNSDSLNDELVYGEVDKIIQQFCDEFLLVCGTKNESELYDKALDLMPTWVNLKEVKFENLLSVLLTALKGNSSYSINQDSIKEKFIAIDANNNFKKVKDLTDDLTNKINGIYSFVDFQKSSLVNSDLYAAMDNNFGICRYGSAASIKMSALVVEKILKEFGKRCLFLDYSVGFLNDKMLEVLQDMMEFLCCVDLFSQYTITILGTLERKLVVDIREIVKRYRVNLIIIEEFKEKLSEECFYVRDLTEESKKQLLAHKLNICGISIALSRIIKDDDSLSELCKVLDTNENEGETNKHHTNNYSRFANISSWYIHRSVVPESAYKTSVRDSDCTVESIVTSKPNQNNYHVTFKYTGKTKVHIVLDDAGIGKSTFFTWLASHLSNNPSNSLVRMDALLYSADFDDFQTKHLNSLDYTTVIRIFFRLLQLTLNANNVKYGSKKESNAIRIQADKMAEFLTISNGFTVIDDRWKKTEEIKPDEMLELCLFQEKWNLKQFVLILDGLDEITPHYKEFVLTYLSKLSNLEGIKSVYISSRPYKFVEELKKTFNNYELYRLSPFSEKHQLYFLHNYLVIKLSEYNQCNKRQRISVLKTTYGLCKKSMEELMHIPLFLHMGCVLILPKLKQYVDFSNGDIDEKKIMQKKVDKLQIIDAFIDNQFKILNTEKCGTTDYSSHIPAMMDKNIIAFKQFKNIHSIMALLEIFGKENSDNILSSIEQREIVEEMQKIEQGSEKTGIILGVHDGYPRFAHRIFAEYFAAFWLLNNTDRMKTNSFFKSWSYWNFKMCQTRRFFDRMVLQKSSGCEVHMALLNEFDEQIPVTDRRKDLTNSFASDRKDALGRLPLHLAVDSFNSGLNSLMIDIPLNLINTKDELFQWSALDYTLANQNYYWFQHLKTMSARVNENTLYLQIISNKLHDMLFVARSYGDWLEMYEHSKMIAHRLYIRLVEYLRDERHLDIITTRNELGNLSVLEFITSKKMYGLLRQFVSSQKHEISSEMYKKILKLLIKQDNLDMFYFVASECNIPHLAGIDDQYLIRSIKFPIKQNIMKTFKIIFQRLCLNRIILSVEDEDLVNVSVSQLEREIPSLELKYAPDKCCLFYNDPSVLQNYFEQGLVHIGFLIEAILAYAMHKGNLKVMVYVISKIKTIVNNKLIITIMRLLPNKNHNRRERYIPFFKYLLDHSNDLHSNDEEGRNLLHWTAQNGCFYMLPCLIAKGFEPSEVNSKNGWNVFHYATYHQNNKDRTEKILNYLMAVCGFNWFSFMDTNFFSNELSETNHAIMSRLTDQQTQKAHKLNKRQYCLIAMFVIFRTDDLARILTDHEQQEADYCLQKINAVQGISTLVEGVKNGIPQFCLRIFADYLAALWLYNNKDRMKEKSFLMSVNCWVDRLRILQMFFDRIVLAKSSGCELHTAVLNRTEEKVREILSTNPSAVDQKDALGRTSLHLTIAYSVLEYNKIINQLLEKMTLDSINVKDNIFQWSALDYAFHSRHKSIINRLIEQKATVNEDTLVQQILSNDLRRLLNDANYYGIQLEHHEHTKVIAHRIYCRLVEYLLNERNLNIFASSTELDKLSIIEFVVKLESCGLLRQFIKSQKNTKLFDMHNKLLEISLKQYSPAIIVFLMSECNIPLPEVNDDHILISSLKVAIKVNQMNTFKMIFQRLCLLRNIPTIKDEQILNVEMPQDDHYMNSLNEKNYPIKCCALVTSDKQLRLHDFFYDDRSHKGSLIEAIIAYATITGNLEIIIYVIMKTNKIVNNKLIYTIMILLPKENYICHKKSMRAFKYLLDQSIDLHSNDEEGLNLLHWTAKHGCFFMLPCLIAKGFNPTLKDVKNGRSGFDYAEFFDCADRPDCIKKYLSSAMPFSSN